MALQQKSHHMANEVPPKPGQESMQDSHHHSPHILFFKKPLLPLLTMSFESLASHLHLPMCCSSFQTLPNCPKWLTYLLHRPPVGGTTSFITLSFLFSKIFGEPQFFHIMINQSTYGALTKCGIGYKIVLVLIRNLLVGKQILKGPSNRGFIIILQGIHSKIYHWTSRGTGNWSDIKEFSPLVFSSPFLLLSSLCSSSAAPLPSYWIVP